jgi:hypothetical protein
MTDKIIISFKDSHSTEYEVVQAEDGQTFLDLVGTNRRYCIYAARPKYSQFRTGAGAGRTPLTLFVRELIKCTDPLRATIFKELLSRYLGGSTKAEVWRWLDAFCSNSESREFKNALEFIDWSQSVRPSE